MAMQMTYSGARAHLRELIDRASDDCETIIISGRRGHRDVALVALDELRGLEETAHLFRSPANAQRLVEAMRRAEAGVLEPMSIDDVATQIGLAGPVAQGR